jgi:tetratricopeptide (TPR) repeat protein
MRLFILLLFALGVVVLFTLFPEIIAQTVRLEAFGWVFETRQGAFITALVILLALLWLLQRIFSAILAGPGQLWRTLRLGGKKRREQRLRNAIADMLDMRGDLGSKSFRKSRGTIPEWGASLLKTLTIPANAQPLPDSKDDALNIALAARIASDPDAPSKPDSTTRKAHLEAWLTAHPDAPLAMARLATLAEEEGDWNKAINLLEQLWKQGERSAASIKPRLAHAYIELAKVDTVNKQSHLRKAQRLTPDSSEIALVLGEAHLASNHKDEAKKLWLSHLERHNDYSVAAALFKLLKSDALAACRTLDKQHAAMTYLPAKRWLQACLAHTAGLTGLANEIIDQLLDEERPTAEVLRSRADWHADAGEWEQAVIYYQRLCEKKPEH